MDKERHGLICVVRFFEAGDSALESASMTLRYAVRQHSRFRASLDDGRGVGVALVRGRVLREGDVLRSDCGIRIVVHAAPEELTMVETTTRLDLARACYHLGNRHVPLQIAEGGVRFQPDVSWQGTVFTPIVDVQRRTRLQRCDNLISGYLPDFALIHKPSACGELRPGLHQPRRTGRCLCESGDHCPVRELMDGL